jgi:ABC-type phosphate transport system substrate-binding protein
MKTKNRRWLLAFAAVLSVMAVSGIGASGASAALGAPCSGTTNITGQGSSLQGAAQDIWTATFNTHPTGCNGALKPPVKYDRSSSGACLSGFGATGLAVNKNFAFCGTDDAPSNAELESITTTAGGAKALTIPVAQAAIAVVINPPANCMVTSGTVTPAQVEQAFRGTTTNWTALGGAGTGCDNPINRVVRADNSGTTFQFKHYLGTLNGAVVHAGQTWTGLQGGANNTTWPHPTSATSPLVRSTLGCNSFMTLPCLTHGSISTTGSGGADEVRTVGANPGSIGYAALSDARAVLKGTEGTWPTLSWLKITNAVGVGQDPSTNGVTTANGTSNCNTNNGAYGAAASLPSATQSWTNVFLVNANNLYPICTLTWDLAFNNYTQAGFPSGTNVARTVTDYLQYVLTPTGGQLTALGSENDYATLPADVRATGLAGITEIVD